MSPRVTPSEGVGFLGDDLLDDVVGDVLDLTVSRGWVSPKNKRRNRLGSSCGFNGKSTEAGRGPVGLTPGKRDAGDPWGLWM